MSLVVLMYHRILSPNDSKKYIKGLPLEKFKEHITKIKECENAKFLDPSELTSNSFEKYVRSEVKYVLMTFDDGYKEHFEIASKLLHRNNIKGLFFIPAQVLDNKFLETNVIQYLVNNIPEEKIIDCLSGFDDFDYDELSKYKNLNIWDTKPIAIAKIYLQKMVNVENKDNVLNILLSLCNSEEYNSYLEHLYVNEEQIGLMKKMGMYIGNHTNSHLHLDVLEIEDQSNEIALSQHRMNSYLDDYFKTISYPFGSYNSDTLKIAYQQGYSLGFTTRSNVCDVDDCLLELPRIDCNDFEKYVL